MSADILNVSALADLVASRVVDQLEARAERRTPVLLTPEQMASRMGVAVKTLANLRSKGAGPKFVKIGGSIRYPVDAPEVKP